MSVALTHHVTTLYPFIKKEMELGRLIINRWVPCVEHLPPLLDEDEDGNAIPTCLEPLASVFSFRPEGSFTCAACGRFCKLGVNCTVAIDCRCESCSCGPTSGYGSGTSCCPAQETTRHTLWVAGCNMELHECHLCTPDESLRQWCQWDTAEVSVIQEELDRRARQRKLWRRAFQIFLMSVSIKKRVALPEGVLRLIYKVGPSSFIESGLEAADLARGSCDLIARA